MAQPTRRALRADGRLTVCGRAVPETTHSMASEAERRDRCSVPASFGARRERRWISKRSPLTPKLHRMEVTVSTLVTNVLAGCWMVLIGVSEPEHRLMKSMLFCELSPFDLGLTLAAVLVRGLATEVMTRASTPRPLGGHRLR